MSTPALKNRIKEVIKEKGYTITSLAEKMGLHRVSLTSMIVSPNSATLAKLSDALEVPVWQFFASPDDVCPSFTALVEDNGRTYSFHSKSDLKAWLDKSSDHD